MRWWRRKVEPPVDDRVADFDQDTILLNDDTDPSSLMMQLALQAGASQMTWDGMAGVWVVTVGGDAYVGQTQVKALMKALEGTA